MNEQEWLECTDPTPMLEFLRGKASERKFRLFAVACCRRLWHYYTNDRNKNAVEVSERYADGLANRHQLREVREAVWLGRVQEAAGDGSGLLSTAKVSLAEAAHATTGRKMRIWAAEVVRKIEGVMANGNPFKWRGEWAAHCALLKEIIGNPFRPVTINPAWLAWNTGTVPKIAQKPSTTNANCPVVISTRPGLRSLPTPCKKPVATTKTFSTTVASPVSMCGAAG